MYDSFHVIQDDYQLVSIISPRQCLCKLFALPLFHTLIHSPHPFPVRPCLFSGNLRYMLALPLEFSVFSTSVPVCFQKPMRAPPRFDESETTLWAKITSSLKQGQIPVQIPIRGTKESERLYHKQNQQMTPPSTQSQSIRDIRVVCPTQPRSCSKHFQRLRNKRNRLSRRTCTKN
jgi:hypothetical protein